MTNKNIFDEEVIRQGLYFEGFTKHGADEVLNTLDVIRSLPKGRNLIHASNLIKARDIGRRVDFVFGGQQVTGVISDILTDPEHLRRGDIIICVEGKMYKLDQRQVLEVYSVEV